MSIIDIFEVASALSSRANAAWGATIAWRVIFSTVKILSFSPLSSKEAPEEQENKNVDMIDNRISGAFIGLFLDMHY